MFLFLCCDFYKLCLFKCQYLSAYFVFSALGGIGEMCGGNEVMDDIRQGLAHKGKKVKSPG